MIHLLVHLVENLLIGVFFPDVANVIQNEIVKLLLLELVILDQVKVFHFISVDLVLAPFTLSLLLQVGLGLRLLLMLVEVWVQVNDLDRVDGEALDIAITVARCDP